MKNVLSTLALAVAALVVAPSALANDVTANISAGVPLMCEIAQATDTDAEFPSGAMSVTQYTQMLVRCNLDQSFTITTPTPDAAGRFSISNGVQTMDVELTSGNSGTNIWGSSVEITGVGTGNLQFVDYGLKFNPDRAYLPAAGTYNGTITFSLTAI